MVAAGRSEIWLVACFALLLAAATVAEAADAPGPGPAALDGSATLLKRADRTQFIGAHDQTRSRQPVRARMLAAGLFPETAGRQQLSFAVSLPAFPGLEVPLPAALAAARANASVSQCDVFTQDSKVQCGNTTFSDLPSFACCTGVADTSACGMSAPGNGTCPEPNLPSCCFARNQDVKACSARASANTCGGSLPVQACCTDTVCKVGRYAKPVACDSGLTSACCPP